MVTPYSRDVYDEPDRHTKYPLNHFSRKNIEYLHSISYPEKEYLKEEYNVKSIGIFGSYVRMSREKKAMLIFWLNFRDQ